MATPERKQKGNQVPGSILETPRTQATDQSRSTSSKKLQKSPNSMMIDTLTTALNNTSISGVGMMNGLMVMNEDEMRRGEIMNETLKNNSKMKHTK